MKTPQQIEEMADDYKPNFPHEECLDRDDLEFIENDEGEQFVSINEIDRVARGCHHHTYQVAYSQAQKDLLESASEGFEEWWRNQNLLYPNLYSDAWQACSLSKMKELQEKDEKIKNLEEKFKAERNDVLYMDKRVLEEKEKYQEVVKDIAYLEEIASTLLLLGEKNTKTTRRVQAIRTKYGLDKKEG